MKKFLSAATAVGLTAVLGAGVADAKGQQEVTFEVTITNTSVLGQIAGAPAGGQIPLSPGVWAVGPGADNPLFDIGQPASAGLEDLAEDGMTAVLLEEAAGINRVRDAAGLPNPAGPILSGESYTFYVTASPGDRLHLATMFVQSNDYFFADSSGIRLFAGKTPIAGDVTSALNLYDAGTEVDQTPGFGDTQVLAQGGMADIGPDENGVVSPAADDGFDLPADEDVIQVTITPVG